MKRDQEHFDELKKLLALKRREQPPPGYFNRFSSRVRARVVAGDTANESRTWWNRWFGPGELKPGLVGLYSVAIGGLLLVGLKTSLKMDQEPSVSTLPEESWLATHTPRTLSESMTVSSNPLQQRIVLSESNSISPLPGSVFFNRPPPQTTPASFKPATGP